MMHLILMLLLLLLYQVHPLMLHLHLLITRRMVSEGVMIGMRMLLLLL